MQTQRSYRLFAWSGAILAASLIAAGFVAAADRPAAPDEPSARTAWQYVGLDRTIARVDPASGRIWILGHPEVSPSVSLLSMLDKPGLRWREIQVAPDKPVHTSTAR